MCLFRVGVESPGVSVTLIYVFVETKHKEKASVLWKPSRVSYLFCAGVPSSNFTDIGRVEALADLASHQPQEIGGRLGGWQNTLYRAINSSLGSEQVVARWCHKVKSPSDGGYSSIAGGEPE